MVGLGVVEVVAGEDGTAVGVVSEGFVVRTGNSVGRDVGVWVGRLVGSRVG
jgi:tetrahydromethanopterin S-methyltransferase subunit G